MFYAHGELVKRLLRRAALMFVLIPPMLFGWAYFAEHHAADIVDCARYSAVCIMFVLAGFILSPLFMRGTSEYRQRAFIYFWFPVAAVFNVGWQIPLTLFRETITRADHTHANLYRFIGWWGYGFADAHYGQVSNWMMSEEAWWLLAIILSLIGLKRLHQGREASGFLWLGIAGVLQAYNASLYMVYDTINGFTNITLRDSVSWLLYWGFNPLWACCALLAGSFSLRFVHQHALRGSMPASVG